MSFEETACLDQPQSYHFSHEDEGGKRYKGPGFSVSWGRGVHRETQEPCTRERVSFWKRGCWLVTRLEVIWATD